ncbi:HEAT repeat protein [Teladorsagia circumcincta]|uniref:HEAT repeat protein n=2 Tax=Teladorsagia circumcincta TaxID=45464 RepID=A0A2G9ULK8_TELCI|nr:HEAT repeat protein [Teladorsagia circumcincta]
MDHCTQTIPELRKETLVQLALGKHSFLFPHLLLVNVFDSLKSIGAHQPNTLLTACHQYLLQNPKLSPPSKAFVLNAIDSVVSDAKIVNELDEQLVLLIINLATQEMTMTSKDADADWAESAKTVLVTLAKSPRFVSHVMDAVLQKFQPGLTTSPHRYIVLTMATVAEHNPFGLVPFLTDILSRTVPLLSHVRSDPLRSAWARAICSFCECIRECETERPQEADEGDVDGTSLSPGREHDNDRHIVLSRHTYTDQAEAIYEVVFQWMYSKDPKTRAEAGECVGELCLMIKPEKVVEDLKKLVSTILGLYKKAYTEQHTITKAVCRFLEATCANESCPLEPYVEDVLNALFPNACLDPDDSSVKRAIVQLCVALSDHAYVDAEGGDHVTAFLVRNLVPPSEQEVQQARKVEVDVAGLNQLRTQCGQALHTIASTCVCANKLLWPYLFEFICTERYFPVVGDICKCLRTLVTRELQEGRELDFETGFDNARVAGNHAVLARLFVCLCNAPLNGLLARRARESYGLMRVLGSWFHPSMTDVLEKWSDRMESLMDEVCSTSLPSPSGECSPAVELRGRRIARWHEACLEMLSACISVVVDGEWRMSLAAVMGKQLDLYKDYPEEKAFLLRCLGTALSKIALKSFVVDHLMLMFKSAQHNIPTERQGCARGVGACASTHTDLVLVELENVSKWEHAKKSSGFFGFIKDAMPIRQYTDTEMVLLRASLMLSYGYVVQACPLDTLTQRLQHTIITFLRHYFANSKQETVVREAMLETMRLIAISVHPSRLPGDYKFDARNELIGYIKDYVQSETPEMLSSSLRLLAAKATAALVRLEPPLSDDDIWDLGCVLTQYILPMCREKSGLKTLAYDLFDYASTSISSFTSSSNRAGTKKIDDDESATIMDATVAQYGNALEAIVEMRPTVGTVTQLLKMLLPYYGKLAEHERSRSIDATVQVLRVYLDRAEDISIGIASDFGPLSSLLARLTPRLVDSLALVRHQSLVAIHYAFRLANAYKVIESRLPQCQMQTYLSALFEMMTDRQSQVSSAAAQLLTYALTCRGAILVHEADTLVTTMLARMPEVHSCVQTYTDLLAALVAFATHQQTVVCDVMLRQPLPQLLDAWECVSRERSLFANSLDYLLELLTGALEHPYDVMDTGGGSSVKIVHVEPCQYTAAITEVIKHGEPEWALYERVPVLFAAMFHMICSVSDTQFPVVVKENKDGSKQPLIITPELRRSAERPAGLAVAALKTLLFRTQSTAVIEDMNQARGWTECLDRELFIGAITVLVRSLVQHRPEWVDSLARSVMEKSSHEREPMRLAAVIVSSALVKKSPDSNGDFNEKLLIDSVRLLENSLTDQSLRIRKLCVRGLGELSECSSEAIAERFASIAVEAAMGGLDDLGDKNDTVAMESIVALNKLVSRTNDAQLHSILRQSGRVAEKDLEHCVNHLGEGMPIKSSVLWRVAKAKEAVVTLFKLMKDVCV